MSRFWPIANVMLVGCVHEIKGQLITSVRYITTQKCHQHARLSKKELASPIGCFELKGSAKVWDFSSVNGGD